MPDLAVPMMASAGSARGWLGWNGAVGAAVPPGVAACSRCLREERGACTALSAACVIE